MIRKTPRRLRGDVRLTPASPERHQPRAPSKTTSPHAAYGAKPERQHGAGPSQISFGNYEEPPGRSAAGVVGRDANVPYGAPSQARAVSSNAYANGADQNCGNYITDRPSTRLHAPPGGVSQISLGGGYEAPAMASVTGGGVAYKSAAKAREEAGHDIFGTGGPAPAPQQQRAYHEPETAAYAPAPGGKVEAEELDIKNMMHADLRTLCRDHGLSPAGCKNTLVERVVEAMTCGRIRVMVPERGVCGAAAVGNNYTRAEGQNTGNFMTGRNSSRVLAPPGGGSSFSLG